MSGDLRCAHGKGGEKLTRREFALSSIAVGSAFSAGLLATGEGGADAAGESELERAIYGRRCVRRFKQGAIPEKLLRKLMDYARLAPTAGNSQKWRFLVVNEPKAVAKVFSCLKWLAASGTPPAGQRPTAYVLMVVGESKYWDSLMAIQNIMLGAQALGIGSCILGSVDRPALQEYFGIKMPWRLMNVVALGYPDFEAEKPVTVDVKDGSTRVWKEGNTLYVPKRKLEDVLFLNKFEGK